MNWPSAVEREQIERAIGPGDKADKLTIIVEEGSPWLLVTAWLHDLGECKLALWRATGAVHKLADDGAVEDEEILPARWSLTSL